MPDAQRYAEQAKDESLSLCGSLWNKIKYFKTPRVEGRGLQITLGVVNILFFGVGTIIGGALVKDLADVIIGILQLCLPAVGWVWSIVWGILMIAGK